MTLRVVLEIVPYGQEENKRVIETINISNFGQIDFDCYQYRVEDNRYKEFREDDVWVEHLRSEGALKLASLALVKVDDQRKNHP